MNTIGVVFLLLLTVSAVAQVQQRAQIGFGPQVGIFKAQDADNVSVMGGAALRLKLSEALGVEGSINYRRETYVNGKVTATSWPVMVTGLIYPVPVLYGAIGAGWYNTSFEYNFPVGALGGPLSTDVTKQEFGWHFGGGFELPLGTVGSLVGDIRYVFLDYKFEDFPGSQNSKSDFYVITVGLLFGL